MSAASHMVPAAPASIATPPWRGRRTQMIFLILLVGLGTILRIANLGGITRRTPDEYTYTESANTLLDLGTTAGYPVLFANFAKDPVRPSPTRLGYHALLMATMVLTGDRTPQAGAWLSCVASVLSLALLAWLGWKFFSPAVAMVATLLYAVSPAELMFARRCWEESLVELLCLALLGVACEVVVGSRRWVLHSFFALIGAAAFTAKELCAAAFLLAAVWCVVVLWRRGEVRSAVYFAGSTLAGVVLALAWSAVRLGGAARLSELRVVISKVPEVSPYAFAYENGPAWLMLLGIWIVSPVTVLLVIAGLATLITRYVAPSRIPACVPNRGILTGLAAGGALFIVLTLVFPEKLDLRFICPSFGSLALLAGVGFCGVLQLIRSILPPTETRTLSVLAVVFLVMGAMYDYSNFAANFAATDMQDLAIRMIVEGSGRTMPASAAPTAETQPAQNPVASSGAAAAQIALSVQLIALGENELGIAAAQRALALDPQSAVAWNNIAAANENLKRWDAAIDAAQRALQLQPEFPLARNNLAWSLAQKANQGGR